MSAVVRRSSPHMMRRRLTPFLLGFGAIAGAIVLAVGYVTQLHGAACDQPYCPSDTALDTSRYLIVIGWPVLAICVLALVAWLGRERRTRRR
jgi:hypothetical protein